MIPLYKTIVVEDEADVREAIISIVDWESQGFSVVGEAGNGQEALDLMQTLEPDLVITDIKMPFMNGIELATAIREINPVTKIVFLSGFNEFDYAISALKLNVIEYILKPVSRRELTETLGRIREKLEEEKRQMRDIEQLRRRYDRDLTILKNAFLISLIKGNPNTEEIAAKTEKYGLALRGECFQLFTLSIDKTSLADSCIETDDMELLLISATEVACRVGEKYVGLENFIYEENVVVILSDTQKNIEDYANIVIREVRQHIRKYCGFSVTIGVSRLFYSLSEANEAYADSISAIHYRLAAGGDKIIYISDFEREGDEYMLPEAQGAAFHSLVKTGTAADVTAFLDELFEMLRESRASLRSYQLCIIELFSQLIKAAKSMPEEVDFNVRDSLEYLSGLYKQDTVDDIKSWFEKQCHAVMGAIDKQRRDSVQVTAEQALDYIEAHYADSKLSLKSLSEVLHMSPNYLSAIIKRAHGESFTNILVGVRMKHAYELLVSTSMSVQEIAEATGYADRHYFSYCFKKYHDISPVQMRNKQKSEREESDEAPVS